MKMNHLVAWCGLAAVLALRTGAVNLSFQGMNISYTGYGTCTIEETLKNYSYALKITGASAESLGSLSIRPQDLNKPLDVAIESITCDAGLNSLKILFPPGGTMPCYVRSISIAGNAKTIAIEGGDLGSPDGRDGTVTIKGDLGALSVNGRAFKVPGTRSSFWMGGNCWADITVDGSIKKLSSKGGNFYYDGRGGYLGIITAGGAVEQILMLGQTIRTNAGDATSAIYRGGSINAYIKTGAGSVIRELKSQGGAIFGGRISCSQLKKLTVVGQKPGAPFFIPAMSQGVFRTYVETTSISGDGTDADVEAVSLKYAHLQDSLFAVAGDIKNIKVSGGMVSNIVMRAGYGGDLSKNQTPAIYPSSLSTSTFAGRTYVIPFRITGQTNEETTIRIHYRDQALDAFLSNSAGAVFQGTNIWRTSTAVSTGFFVWATETNTMTCAPGIVIRVHDDGTPNKYSDCVLNLSAISNVAPVQLIISPPDSPRTNAAGLGTLVWQLDVANPLQQGTINYQASGVSAIQLGIAITNLSAQSAYAYTSQPLLPGDYTDIVFSADNGFFTDTKAIIVVITGVFSKAAWSEPAREASPTSAAVDRAEDTFSGGIGNIVADSNMFDSIFAAAVTAPMNNWDGADCQADIRNLNVKGTVTSNTFVSRKKINIAKKDTFNFAGNFIWIGGVLNTNGY